VRAKTLAVSAIVASLLVAVADFSPAQTTKPKATTKAPANANQQKLVDAEAKLIEDNLHAWWKKHAKKGDDDKYFMGPEEAARAFGYTYAYNSSRLNSPLAVKKEDPTAGTSEGSKTAAKTTTTVSDSVKKRLDWLFINTLDKDSDEKVSEDEYNDWAKSYALILAEEVILSSQLGAPNAANNPNYKQMQQRMQQLQKQMQAFAKAMSRRKG
jgi:hypothetical protein